MKTLGPYTLTRRLGAGGMGEVWMARRSAIGGAAKVVAVKTLLPQRANDEVSRKMFIDEARLSMLLSNSNIVQVFDVGEADDGSCFMAMEWVEGLNLLELCEQLAAREETLPLPIVAYVIGEVLKALAHAHELVVNGEHRTIVHRDISPHNVMLSVAGEVKLMDFGVARLTSEETSGVHVKGKLRYMPPEQLRGDARGPKLDLFAVGAMLHELLEAKKFRGGVVDDERLIGMILDGEVPPLTCKDRIPPELAALVEGLLSKQPEDRFSSARVAYRVLTQWSGYHDAKFELQDMVRRFVEPAPDVSTTIVLTTSSESAATEDARGDGSDTGVTTHMDPVEAWNHPTAVSRADIMIDTEHPRVGRRRWALGLVFATISLACGVMAVGTFYGWWRRHEPVRARFPTPQWLTMPAVPTFEVAHDVSGIDEARVEPPATPSPIDDELPELPVESEPAPEPVIVEPALATANTTRGGRPSKRSTKRPRQVDQQPPPKTPKKYHPDLKNPFE